MRIEHRIGIAANTDSIWEVLSDLEHWGDWNPLYPRAAGTIRIGAALDIDEHVPGLKVHNIRPVVLDWAPYDHIHWKTSMWRGWASSTRFLEIEELAPGSCIFSNGEVFSGLLVDLAVPRSIRPKIRQGFAAMGEALKAEAEKRWNAGGQAPNKAR
ncbi:MAG TPA: SRPBCC domain-containing protein [Caulobacter sp.]|nr:SRPBCC domain-containing protein [Caulobacter sp.]